MNFIRGALDGEYFVTETLKLPLPADKLARLNDSGYQRKAVVLGIRPEDIFPGATGEETTEAKITVAELTGAEFMLYATVGGHEMVVRAGADKDYHAEQRIQLAFDMNKCHVFDSETETAIV